MSAGGSSRSGGFTLVEMMLALAIFSLVVGGLMTSLVAIRKMSLDAFATAELSVRTRELRDKLLFHAAPPHGGCVWAGIRSGNAGDDQKVVQGAKIRMLTFGVRTDTGNSAAQTIELVPSADGATRRFVNDGDRIDDRWTFKWLDPGRIGFLPAAAADVDAVESVSLGKDAEALAVNLSAAVRPYARADEIVNAERLVIPVFGREVPKNSLGVFTDD